MRACCSRGPGTLFMPIPFDYLGRINAFRTEGQAASWTGLTGSDLLRRPRTQSRGIQHTASQGYVEVLGNISEHLYTSH
jgi:hypothetical protein